MLHLNVRGVDSVKLHLENSRSGAPMQGLSWVISVELGLGTTHLGGPLSSFDS